MQTVAACIADPLVNIRASVDQCIKYARLLIDPKGGRTLSLWIKVHQQDTAIAQRQSMREGRGACGFSDPTFSVWGDDVDAHNFTPVIVFNMSNPSSVSFQMLVCAVSCTP